MNSRTWKAAVLCAATFQVPWALAQWSFELDTAFRTAIMDQNVNAVHVLQDGKIFASGRIRFAGDMSDRGSARLLNDGQQDVGFPMFPQTTGAGKVTPWIGGKFYVVSTVPWRMMPDGLIDPSFGPVGIGPYFQQSTTGDYHVFPDGRVLMSGSHWLHDSIRGFEGLYELIWFTNTGYLDTTRTHRNANGPIWEFKELPNGQFICTCNCTVYEGQPVNRVFRVHADGSLDESFQSTITMGNIYEIEGLPDGSVLLGGNFRFSSAPQDTVRFAKLLSDGSRDPGFASMAFAGNDAWWPSSGTIVFDIFPFHGGNYILAGQFTTVNGQQRKGLCMVDGSGQLLEAFDECGVGPFTYQTTTNATPLNIYWNQDSTALYICGAYTGYDDGTTNDPQQRFVSRLLVEEDLTTGTHAVRAAPPFSAYPNPARASVIFAYDRKDGGRPGSILVRDLAGRTVANLMMTGQRGQQTWDTRQLAPGTYLVQYLGTSEVLHTEKLIIQQ
jgi:hypothetical protein